MSGFESRKAPLRCEVARFDVRIEVLEQLGKCIGIALRVAARVDGIPTCRWIHERRILHHFLVRLFTPPYPERVRIFSIERQRPFRPIYLKPQSRFSAS